MKKKTITAAFVAAIAIFAGTTVYNVQKPEPMSEVALANVEALAHDESWGCDNGCVSGNGGCYCNGWYEYYKEYQW